jgi:hypothetical protein
MSQRKDSACIFVRLSPKEHEQFKKTADKLGVNMSDLVRVAINKLLAEQEIKQKLPVRKEIPFVI